MYFSVFLVIFFLAGYLIISRLGEVKTEYLRRHYVEKTLRDFFPSGKILEVGSGKQWKYAQESITLNRDGSADPDIIGDAEQMPFDSYTFDTVYCLEVIEHTKEPQKILDEIYRVLKPGGKILLTVPFMFEIHDKEDYRRYTSKGLEYLFRNFSNVEITSNGWIYSLLCHIIRSTYLGERTSRFWNNLGFYLDKVLCRNKTSQRFTLGWSVVARKK